MELHSTKRKRAPGGKRALLRLGSLVVSAAIALSPGVVPAMTALRAMADEGELVTVDASGLPPLEERENAYIHGLFYGEWTWDNNSSGTLANDNQKRIYTEVSENIKSVSDGGTGKTSLTFSYSVPVSAEFSDTGSVTDGIITGGVSDLNLAAPDADGTPNEDAQSPDGEAELGGDTADGGATADNAEADAEQPDDNPLNGSDATDGAPTGSALTGGELTDGAPTGSDLTDGEPTDGDPTGSDLTDGEPTDGDPTDEEPTDGNAPAAPDPAEDNAQTGDDPTELPTENGAQTDAAAPSADAIAAARTKMTADIDAAVGRAFTDLPARLYWCEGWNSIELTSPENPSEITFSVNFTVVGKYRGDNNTVNADIMEKARNAANKARDIARSSGAAKDKIKNFCNSIHTLVSGGVSAAADALPKNGMWGIVDVFAQTGTPTSEDLANSLDALCKISKISGVECLTVKGTKSNNLHTWNIVRIDGDSYLVDLAAYDGKSEPLKIAASSDKDGCTADGVEYKYFDDTKSMFGDKLIVKTDKNDPGTIDPGTIDPGTNDPDTNDPDTNDPDTNDPGTNVPAELGHSGHNWEYDDNCHWKTCPHKDCVNKSENNVLPAPHEWLITKIKNVNTVPTCTKKGVGDVEVICEVCGKRAELTGYELPMSEHSPVWQSNDTKHWQECKYCHGNKTAEEAHNIDERSKAATTTEPGYREKYCTTCEKILSREVIPILSKDHTTHNYNIRKSDSTRHWMECECGEKSGIADHTTANRVAIITAATCGAAGTREVITYCTTCAREISRKNEAIPATNYHTYEKGVCKICGAKDSSYIEPHTHKASSTWYSDTLTHWQLCEAANCNEKMNMGPHKTDAGTIAYPATATMTGLKVYSCSECGKILRTEVIPVVGSTGSSSSSTRTSSSSSSIRPGSSSSTTTYNPPSDSSSSYIPGNVNITQSADSGANAPRSQIRSSNNTLFNALLTSYERERVQNGESMTVRLTVDNANYSVPDTDRAAVERTVSTLSNFMVGQYLDVNLYKTVGSDRKQILASINDLTITFDIPEEIRGKSSYSVVRVHDGNSTILRDLDNDPNTITIETSLFSTYAIIYRDQSSNFNPSTGITESPYLVSTIIGASAFIVMNVIISVVGKKKRKSKG